MFWIITGFKACKMLFDNNTLTFLALVSAGLWETEVKLASYRGVDYESILRIAREQSVIGLVAAGLEHVTDVKIPQVWALQFAGETIQLELRNKDMNQFIADLITKMDEEGIWTLLVKGQGIAQCYERPMWRCPGDIDLFLSDDNYSKAKKFLAPLASSIEEENSYTQHAGMMFGSMEVELHGNLRGDFSSSSDNVLDKMKEDVFHNGNVRLWQNDRTPVFLMSATCDAFYIFTHILQHFFRGGIGLRQICDWCRLLYTYRDKLDLGSLESRLMKAGLMSEWKAFGALAVEWLRLPVDAMPFYSDKTCWRNKANKLLKCIIETGNFGHNIDNSYRTKNSFWVRKMMAMRKYTSEAFSHFMIFPMNTMRNYVRTMKSGLLSTLGLK